MRSGELCKCRSGRMRTYCSRTVGASRIRYLRCTECGTKAQEFVSVDDLGRTILQVRTMASRDIAHGTDGER